MIERDAYDPGDAPLTFISLATDIRSQVIEHLRATLPNEGCGLLAIDPAQRNRVVHFYPGSNIDASPTRFTMDAREVIDAFRHMEQRGWRLGAIVHSHPNAPASPSPTDLIEALYPAALMIIASFRSEDPELRAWALAPNGDRPAVMLGERPIHSEPESS